MNTQYPPQQLQHTPVLLDAVLRVLKPEKGETYLDLTAGYGGHAQAVLERTGSSATLVDRDMQAISHLEGLNLKNVTLLDQDFASAALRLVEHRQQFDMILVDLGVSSPQLDITERGFSFRLPAAIDMRMDRRQERTAKTLVNELSEHELVSILQEYGEEPRRQAQLIAQAIIAKRPIENTDQLAEIVKSNIRGKGKIHPATRTFQAFRIATNDEIGQIQTLLPLLPQLLNQGGRVAVISFHSLEDRLVKRYFASQKEMGLEAELSILTKRPIKGSDEDVHNPRARSAMLRAAVKK